MTLLDLDCQVGMGNGQHPDHHLHHPESSRIKNMFGTVPINHQPPVFIDLTVRSIAAEDIGEKVVGLTPRTPQVADSGVVATSSTAAKGKRMVHSIGK